MNAHLMRSEEQMTDFQFKALVKMAMTIVRESSDKETAVKNLEKLLYADERDLDTIQNKDNK